MGMGHRPVQWAGDLLSSDLTCGRKSMLCEWTLAMEPGTKILVLAPLRIWRILLLSLFERIEERERGRERAICLFSSQMIKMASTGLEPGASPWAPA